MGKDSSTAKGRLASVQDISMQAGLRAQLREMSVPILQRRRNSHEYLFLAFLDGTGQDVNNPELGPATSVGILYQQAVELANDPENRIGANYSRGIGAQPNAVARALDGLTAHTWDKGIKDSYTELAIKAASWTATDPDAEVRVVGTGYSRGAVQTVALHRLIDQFGIADPKGLQFGRDEAGNLSVVSLLPPLVPPGKVAQATLLFDPVATNMPRNFDARLPPSVISRVSITAAHERRELFPHQTINDPGMTPDRRAINVEAPGGHSNVGGGNRDAGLEILTGNAAIDYLNTLLEEPLFQKRTVPMDLDTMALYQASGATALYGLRMDGDDKRNLRDVLANCKIVDPCKDSELIDQTLAAQFEHRRIAIDAAEQALLESLLEQAASRDLVRDSPAHLPLQMRPDSPQHPEHSSLLRIRDSVQTAERSGQICFADDQQREQFCRSALACMKDNRETRQVLYPDKNVGLLPGGEIGRVDDVVVGSKGYAFLIEKGRGPHDLRRVPIDVELAKQTPVAVSDQKLEAARHETEPQTPIQLQPSAQMLGEHAVVGMSR